MKQDVAEYLIDSFVDFKGEEHKIVACALSQSPEGSEDGCKLAVGWVSDDSYVDTYDPDYAEICRVISVGISVCSSGLSHITVLMMSFSFFSITNYFFNI